MNEKNIFLIFKLGIGSFFLTFPFRQLSNRNYDFVSPTSLICIVFGLALFYTGYLHVTGKTVSDTSAKIPKAKLILAGLLLVAAFIFGLVFEDMTGIYL